MSNRLAEIEQRQAAYKAYYPSDSDLWPTALRQALSDVDWLVAEHRETEWEFDTPPSDGTWCWVSDGTDVWIAKRDAQASGRWSNEDTWEDVDGKVRCWIPLATPEPPKE